MDYIRGKRNKKDSKRSAGRGSPGGEGDEDREERTNSSGFDYADPNFYQDADMPVAELGDAVDKSSELFSQLDTMIRTVQEESNALDSMRAKLKELNSMKQHISALTKRLLGADQSILNLKGSLVKMQDAYTKMKEAKQDLEGQLAPIKNELIKTRQAYKAENVARLSAQQENTMLKERLEQTEDENHNLKRENKAIPSLNESLDIVKSDLSQLRQKYKQDRKQMENTLRRMEEHSRSLEMNRGETRKLAMELLDVTDGELSRMKRQQAAMSQKQQQQFQSPGSMPVHASSSHQQNPYSSPHHGTHNLPQLAGGGAKPYDGSAPILTYY